MITLMSSLFQHFSLVVIHENFVSADEELDLQPFQLLILALCF